MELSMEKLDDLIKVYDEKNESWKFIKRDKGFNKQLMMVEDTLSRFGLLKNEIRVYVYLARAGERKAAEVAEAILLHRTETYRILRDLEKKGIVFAVTRVECDYHAPAVYDDELTVTTEIVVENLLHPEPLIPVCADCGENDPVV